MLHHNELKLAHVSRSSKINCGSSGNNREVISRGNEVVIIERNIQFPVQLSQIRGFLRLVPRSQRAQKKLKRSSKKGGRNIKGILEFKYYQKTNSSKLFAKLALSISEEKSVPSSVINKQPKDIASYADRKRNELIFSGLFRERSLDLMIATI